MVEMCKMKAKFFEPSTFSLFKKALYLPHIDDEILLGFLAKLNKLNVTEVFVSNIEGMWNSFAMNRAGFRNTIKLPQRFLATMLVNLDLLIEKITEIDINEFDQPNIRSYWAQYIIDYSKTINHLSLEVAGRQQGYLALKRYLIVDKHLNQFDNLPENPSDFIPPLQSITELTAWNTITDEERLHLQTMAENIERETNVEQVQHTSTTLSPK